MFSCLLVVIATLAGASYGKLQITPTSHSKRNDGRILGGTAASLNQFPYMISMFSSNSFSCGGSILSANTIVTAAHCTRGVAAFQVTVNAGSLNLGQGVTLPVSRIIEHQNYNPFYLTSDIALLILQTPLQLSDSIQPIQVERSYINSGVNAISTGWGLTNYPGNASPVLLYIQLATVENLVCQWLMYPNPIQSDQLCAYSGNAGRGICRGDSGGPLAVNGKLVGITSWVKAYCAKGYPDVFTRVSVYADWIDNNMV